MKYHPVEYKAVFKWLSTESKPTSQSQAVVIISDTHLKPRLYLPFLLIAIINQIILL